MFLCQMMASFGQCGIFTSNEINDLSTTSLTLLVNNATNNTLGQNGQGVCMVMVKFKHQVEGDVNMYLIAPNGQTIQLVGSGGEVSSPTFNITWDVSFIPSASPALPDPGIGDVWNNNELWTNSANRVYKGSYYPFDGSLEDFDGGTVNGSWTLVVEDVVENDAGVVDSFSIVFCDETNVNCNECLPDYLTPISDTIEICRGTAIDPSLLKVTNGNLNPDTINYRNDFLIFGNNQFKGRLTSTDETTLIAGHYKLCAIHYHEVDSLNLPSSNLIKDTTEYQLLINQNGFCAKIGECIDLEVLPVSDTIFRTFEICKGDSLTIYGITIKEEGKYYAASVAGKCDTIVELNLDVIDLGLTMSQNFPVISCLNKEIVISANVEEQGKMIGFTWSTIGGNIKATNGNQITVNAPGLYIVEASYMACKMKDTIVIGTDINTPNINLAAETLTCRAPVSTIMLTASLPISSAIWTGPGIVSQTGFNVNVNTIGIYTVTTLDDNGCESIASINIKENKVKPTISFYHDSIRCEKNAFNIIVSDSFNIQTTYLKHNNIITTDALNKSHLTTGNHILVLEGFNGCIDSFLFVVEDLRYTILVNIMPDTFTCEKKFIIPKLTTDRPVISYDWNGPVAVIDVVNPTLTKEGLYTLMVKDVNNCKGATSIFYEIDTIAPALLMSGRMLGCNPDSVLLIADNYNPNLNYTWSGPGLSSNEDSVFVKVPNVYSVTATDKNQCTKRAFFNVSPAMDLPDVEFIAENIECLKTLASITPDKTNGFTFLWFSSAMLNANTEPIGLVDKAGTYQVRVTNAAGCYRNYAINVGDIRQQAIINILSDTIGCNDDSIQIKLDIDIPYESIEWSTGGSSFSSVEDPFISDGGIYNVSIIDSFGCIFLDTVTIVKDLSISGITTTSAVITCDTSKQKITAFLNETGATYAWYSGNQIVGNSDTLLVDTGGRYKVIVQNLRGCIDSAFVDVMYDTIKPLINLISIPDLDCAHKEVDIKLTVNKTIKEFSWAGDGIVSIDANNSKVSKEGIFTYTVKDTRHCISSVNFTVADSSKFTLVSISKKDISCDSMGSVLITFTDPTASVKWEAPVSIPNNTKAVNVSKEGKYKFTLTNSLGCITTDSVSVMLDTIKPVITKIINGEINCELTTVAVGVETSSSIEKVIWNNLNFNTLIANVGKKGSYTGSLTAFNGCKTNFTVNVTENIKKPVITIIGDTIDCQRSKIDLILTTLDSLKSIVWSGPNQQVLNGKKVKITQAGKYLVTATGINGCVTFDSIIIEDKKVFPFVALQDTFLMPCNGDSVQLFITTQDTIKNYRWIGNDFFSTDSVPMTNIRGEVILLLGTVNGCVYTDTTYLITDPGRPNFGLINDTITCSPGFANITAINIADDIGVYWKDENNIITPGFGYQTSVGGNYYLIVEGINKCRDSILFEVKVDTIYPSIEIEQSELFGCDHLTVELLTEVTQTTNFDFHWSTDDGHFVKDTNSLTPSINAGGEYHIQVKNMINSCISEDSILVSGVIRTLDSYTFSTENPVCFGDANGSIILNNISGGIPPYIISVNGNVVNQPVQLDNLNSGDYFINISDSFGCLLDTVILLTEGFDYSVILPQDTLIDIGYDLDIFYFVDESINIVESIWKIDDLSFCEGCESVNLSPINSTLVHLSVVNDLGCKAEDEILIIVNNKIAIDIPNVFYPNSNSGNDRFYLPEIPGIKEILNVEIYDNWGNIVYTNKNFPSGQKDMGWDGNFNGKELNPGVFVVFFDILLLDDSRIKFYRDITLVR